MRFSITTTAHLSVSVALDVLNVAINGGCEAWAIVTDKRPGPEIYLYESAKFCSRAEPSVCMTVTIKDVTAGIQKILDGGFPVTEKVKKRVLRVIANNNTTEVDIETADSIVRAAWMKHHHKVAGFLPQAA